MSKRTEDCLPSEPTASAALSALAPELAATVARVAGDIALVIDDTGVICSAAFGSDAFAADTGDWVGRRLSDTVTAETKRKIEMLLSDAEGGGVVRRREVNHPTHAGQDLPVSYTAVRLGSAGPLLVVGRDLRSVSAIQQQFVESQQAMERDYWQRRQDEARYRLLFQVATDAVVVADARSRRVIEANRAAAELFGASLTDLPGCDVAEWIAPAGRAAVEDLLAAAHSTGRAAEIRARLARGGASVSLAVTPFAHDATPLLLLRARRLTVDVESDPDTATLIDLVERTPDAIVVTDLHGRLRVANPSFLALCGLAADARVAGRSLGEWIGASPQEAETLVEHARRLGIVARAGTRVRLADGQTTEVELSAALLPEGEDATIGITLRPLSRGAPVPVSVADELVFAVEQLVRRLGDENLPSLMREANDLIERQLLKAALARSGDDRNRAAELLGISRDSLDLRLIRQRLGMAEAIPLRPSQPPKPRFPS